jgi:elongation factor 1-beta
MGTVLITYKIMPESDEVDLNNFEEEISSKITSFGGRIINVEEELVAFGLKALKIVFTLDESKGDTEELERTLQDLHYIQSVEVVDVRRQIG